MIMLKSNMRLLRSNLVHQTANSPVIMQNGSTKPDRVQSDANPADNLKFLSVFHFSPVFMGYVIILVECLSVFCNIPEIMLFIY